MSAQDSVSSPSIQILQSPNRSHSNQNSIVTPVIQLPTRYGYTNSQLRARTQPSPIAPTASNSSSSSHVLTHEQHLASLQKRAYSEQPPSLHHISSSSASSTISYSATPATTSTTTKQYPYSRGKSSPPPSPGGQPGQRAGALFLHLLFFVAGMAVTYILVVSVGYSGAMLNSVGEGRMKNIELYKQDSTLTTSTEVVTTTLPLCSATNYVDGSWEYDPSITKAPYKSNEWDNKCDEPGYTNSGEKIPDNFTPPTIRSELQYVWQPKECRLAPYSRENFCKLLAGRNVLFVGDSIAGQHVHSFVHLLHQTPNNIWIRDEFFREDMINVCQEYYPVNGVPSTTSATPVFGFSSIYHPRTFQPLPGLRVGFKRNNFLNLHFDSNTTMAYRKWNTNQSWVGDIDKWKYDIVVLNTGIWMIEPEIYRQMLVEISSFMKEQHPKITFLWRSTQPGHAHCHTHWARPQKRLNDIRDTTGGQARFRWEEADERNRIAKEIFPNEYMDVVTMTKLRPDGHMPGECLHYCQPGPVDEWQKVLYHRLALLQPSFLEQFESTRHARMATSVDGPNAAEFAAARKMQAMSTAPSDEGSLTSDSKIQPCQEC